MHHMADAWNAVKLTLDDASMKSERLCIGVNEPVFIARDDTDWHLQACILILEGYGARNHESRFRGRCSNLRWAYRHFPWKSGKL